LVACRSSGRSYSLESLPTAFGPSTLAVEGLCFWGFLVSPRALSSSRGLSVALSRCSAAFSRCPPPNDVPHHWHNPCSGSTWHIPCSKGRGCATWSNPCSTLAWHPSCRGISPLEGGCWLREGPTYGKTSPNEKALPKQKPQQLQAVGASGSNKAKAPSWTGQSFPYIYNLRTYWLPDVPNCSASTLPRRLRLRGGSSGRHISSYAMPPETVSSILVACR